MSIHPISLPNIVHHPTHSQVIIQISHCYLIKQQLNTLIDKIHYLIERAFLNIIINRKYQL